MQEDQRFPKNDFAFLTGKKWREFRHDLCEFISVSKDTEKLFKSRMFIHTHL